MKLLSPSQVADIKSQELARELLRTQEYNKEADKARKNLANAEADFNETLAKHRTRWAEEEKNHAQRVVEMDREVGLLESRRTKALEPIETLERNAELKMQEADNLLLDLKGKSDDLDELNEKLQDRLDELGERESNILMAESRIKSMREGAERQHESVKEQTKNLSEAIKKFNAEKLIAEKNLQEQQTQFILQERSLLAKKNTLDIKEKNLIEQSTMLNNERIQLDSAWQELYNKSS